MNLTSMLRTNIILQSTITDESINKENNVNYIKEYLDDLRSYLHKTNDVEDFELGIILFEKWKTWLIHGYSILYEPEINLYNTAFFQKKNVLTDRRTEPKVQIVAKTETFFEDLEEHYPMPAALQTDDSLHACLSG